MSTIRRIIAVGLPAAGLTAALALGVSPALATSATVDQAAMPVVAATGYGTPDADDEAPTRGQGGYGTPGATSPTGNAAETPDTDTDMPDTDTPDTDMPDSDTPTRGNNGYGPTPTASVDTVPPSVSPTTSSPGVAPATTTPGGGVSPAGALPVTGAPMTAIISMGALLVAAGAASVWYTRRRRTA